jgi:drug/metabolite transporter (DMT)-like permease
VKFLNKLSTSNKKLFYIIITLVSVYIFWGGTYLGMKVAIETIPPFIMAGVRFLIAGAVLYFISRLMGVKRPNKKEWKGAGIVGALLLLGGNGVIAWAEQRVPSGIASLIVATVPLWIILFSWLGYHGKKPNTGVIIGIVLGLIGIGTLVLTPGSIKGNHGIDLIGILALLFASLSWSFGSLYSRRAVLPKSPLMSTALQMLVGCALLLLVSFFLGDWSKLHVSEISFRSYVAMGYLIFFGSIIGYNAYIWLFKNAEPSLVSTYDFVNPIIAVFLGWLLAKEKLNSNSLIASVIIISAVIIITVYRDRDTKAVK